MNAFPQRMARPCALTGNGGVAIVDDLVTASHLQAMREEARQARANAAESHIRRYDAEPWRGGNPARRFLSAPAGAVQQALYHHPGTLRLLEKLIGSPTVPSGGQGTYTYYTRAGDFIGIHRDIQTCDVAVITCLEDCEHPPGNAGNMVFYPERRGEDNLAIRRTPARGAVLHHLAPSETVVLLGGIVAHAVLPVIAKQERVVSVLCYTAAGMQE